MAALVILNAVGQFHELPGAGLEGIFVHVSAVHQQYGGLPIAIVLFFAAGKDQACYAAGHDRKNFDVSGHGLLLYDFSNGMLAMPLYAQVVHTRGQGIKVIKLPAARLGADFQLLGC
jgi:hypothetical protein